MNVVDEIVGKITDVQVESVKSIESFEQIANRFLDSIIDFQKELSEISHMTSDLSEYLYERFDKVDKDGYLIFRSQLRSVLQKLYGIYVKCRKEQIVYSSSKAIIKDFKCSILDLSEAVSDFEIYKLELENSKEYKELAKQINEM